MSRTDFTINYKRYNAFLPSFLNEKFIGTLISLFLHIGIILLFSTVSVSKMIPHQQIIHMTFFHDDGGAAGNRLKGAAQVIQSKSLLPPKRVQEWKVIPAQKASPPKELIAPESAAAVAEKISSGENPVEADNLTPAAGARGSDEKQGTSYPDVAGSHAGSDRQGAYIESRFGDSGAPYFIHQEMPVYPALARKMGKEGRVLLKLFIDANGRLQNIEVVEAAGFGFTEATMEAVKKSKYAPGYYKGMKVATKVLLPVRFRLQ